MDKRNELTAAPGIFTLPHLMVLAADGLVLFSVKYVVHKLYMLSLG